MPSDISRSSLASLPRTLPQSRAWAQEPRGGSFGFLLPSLCGRNTAAHTSAGAGWGLGIRRSGLWWMLAFFKPLFALYPPHSPPSTPRPSTHAPFPSALRDSPLTCFHPMPPRRVMLSFSLPLVWPGLGRRSRLPRGPCAPSRAVHFLYGDAALPCPSRALRQRHGSHWPLTARPLADWAGESPASWLVRGAVRSRAEAPAFTRWSHTGRLPPFSSAGVREGKQWALILSFTGAAASVQPLFLTFSSRTANGRTMGSISPWAAYVVHDSSMSVPWFSSARQYNTLH